MVGLLTLRDLCRTPREQWEATTVGQVMGPLPQLHTITPHQSVHEVNRVPAVERSRLVGVVSWEDLLRFVDIRRYARIGDGGETLFVRPIVGHSLGSVH